MAAKILKNREQFTSTLRNDLIKKLREYSIETGIPITKILDKSLEEYFNKQKT